MPAGETALFPKSHVKDISLKGGQKPNVYFSLTLDSYDSAIHDNMTEEDVKAFFDRGIQTTPPEIKQSGNWVVYYRIEAENEPLLLTVISALRTV